MGGGSDDAAVVDTRLRVRGVESLRVADASIMPAMPGAQLGATVFAIAEKAADMILRGQHGTAPGAPSPSTSLQPDEASDEADAA
jgi:choline dehydrogenase